MKNLIRVVAALVVIGVVALLAIIFVPVQRTAPTEQVASDWKPAKGEGAYLARLGDCAACHTSSDSKPFAGGHAIDSPMGTIYTSNITPDKETGIGTWTLADFRGALIDGVSKDGKFLYPAMPYENYRNLSEKDIVALYDYFMHDVTPVRNEPQKTALSFPFNQRWGIRLWNWVNLGKAGFHPEAAVANDPKLARGAYIAQVLGHCGACHSPRNLMMAQAGKTSEDAKFLAGGEIAGWSAPDLRGPTSKAQIWSADELKMYLLSGRNAHSAVAGEMSLAVRDSLQYMTDEDANDLVAYIRAIGTAGPAKEQTGPRPVQQRVVDRVSESKDPTAQKLNKGVDLTLGERLYMDNCAACHFTDGKGSPDIFPELANGSAVLQNPSAGFIHTILFGAQMPSTRLRPEAIKMPGFADRLSDKEVAALATFVRSAWGNKAPAIKESEVTKVRAEGRAANQ